MPEEAPAGTTTEHEIKVANQSLDNLVGRAQYLLARFNEETAWMIFYTGVTKQLDLGNKPSQSMVGMLVAAAFRLARQPYL